MNGRTNIRIPSFFIVGEAKAGTTTLWEYLRLHPQVFVPTSDLYKEPAFFCKNWGIQDFEEYRQLFARASSCHKRIGEASTAYIRDETVPETLKLYGKEFGIHIQIIICLRNPVDRAYSLYNWNVQSGIEPAGSFERALKLESKRIQRQRGPWPYHRMFLPQYLYVETGKYTNRIRMFIRTFGRENVHIVVFEEMIENQCTAFKNMCNFLEVDFIKMPIPNLHKNASQDVISPKLQVILKQCTKYLIKYRLHSAYESISERDFLLQFGLRNRKPPAMKEETRELLQDAFAKDIIDLEVLLGRNFDIWRRWEQRYS